MERDTELRDPDPDRRRTALGRVRFRDLKDPTVLRAVLDLCRDATPTGGASGTGDPFAAFFTGAETGATVADVAAERLDRTGLPPDPASVETIRATLEADGPPGRLPSVVARALGDTRWVDLDGALRSLVPALDRYDEPLFAAIVALPSAAAPTLAYLAAHPLRLRLLQELLNHPPTRPIVVEAVEQAFRAYPPSRDEAAAVLAVLAAWSDPAVARIASALADRFPWVVAWQALEDPRALPALSAWLADGPDPVVLGRVSEILRQRDLPDGFPLAAWLRAAGEEHGLARTFGVDDAVSEVLSDWVAATADHGERPGRGWTAVSLLARGRTLPARVAEQLPRLVAERHPERMAPWDRELLETLARAAPPVPGVAELLLSGLRARPEEAGVAVPALLAQDDALVRSAVLLLLERAEGAPVVVERAGRATVRERRDGIDTEALGPLVERLGDPALAARLDAVLPVVRAG